jgi:hypothetical protein
MVIVPRRFLPVVKVFIEIAGGTFIFGIGWGVPRAGTSPVTRQFAFMLWTIRHAFFASVWAFDRSFGQRCGGASFRAVPCPSKAT